MARFLTF